MLLLKKTTAKIVEKHIKTDAGSTILLKKLFFFQSIVISAHLMEFSKWQVYPHIFYKITIIAPTLFSLTIIISH